VDYRGCEGGALPVKVVAWSLPFKDDHAYIREVPSLDREGEGATADRRTLRRQRIKGADIRATSIRCRRASFRFLNSALISKAAFDAAKMVIDKSSIDSNKAWQTAYKNVVTAVGRRYKKFGQRENGIEEGEGASERTKY
jgi:hypothetical protein